MCGECGIEVWGFVLGVVEFKISYIEVHIYDFNILIGMVEVKRRV